MSIAIILSTYNGEQYLKAQLDSILIQSVPSDIIVIRDDGSTDSTPSILKEYQKNHSNMLLLEDEAGNIGILCSYSLLLKYVATLDISYYMFADQDDVWFADKTEQLLSLIQKMDNSKPALVFSDVTVVDSDLNILNPSLVAHQQLVPEKANHLKSLLFYCPALGCAMLFNKALLNELLSLSDNFPNPDKWALLVAAVLGEIQYLPKQTLYHRHHVNNATSSLGIHRKKLSAHTLPFIQKRYQTALNEARVLEAQLAIIPKQHKQVIKQFQALFVGNYFARIINYVRFFLSPPHWHRKAGLFISLFQKYE